MPWSKLHRHQISFIRDSRFCSSSAYNFLHFKLSVLPSFLSGFIGSDWREHDEHLNLRPVCRALYPLLDQSTQPPKVRVKFVPDFLSVAFVRRAYTELNNQTNRSVQLSTAYPCLASLLSSVKHTSRVLLLAPRTSARFSSHRFLSGFMVKGRHRSRSPGFGHHCQATWVLNPGKL
jgi:hypothetical protein